ncbi:MAG TPA: hypothetical protein VFR65_04610 [Nitrososphaeraceae archaeon]|jgi:hypothetical protein|nr:hypothetical protein [Nitrososphaeraceae archaeon]
MKSRNIFVYTILAIGILSIPSLLDTVQAQTNSTNQTSAQNQTMSKDTQALMTIDLPELKDTLMNAKNALANNDTEEALTSVTDVENQLLTLQPQPKFTADFQKIKDAVSKNDVNKALDDLTKVQSDLLKAETEMLKAQLANPMLSQQNNGPQDQDDNGDGDDGGDDGTN